MSIVERPLGGPEIEVVAKATRRRFTLEYKRKIVREADRCKTPRAVGALRRGRACTLPTCDLAYGARSRRVGGDGEEAGPVPQIADARDRKIAELE
jgi:hypothetical protein